MKRNYAKNGFETAIAAPYFFDMPDYFRRSDLIISRAGATTCAELIASQKASILIPFAKAAGDHQAHNSAALKAIGGADVILESEWKPELLAGKILCFLGHKDRISVMEKNLALLKKEAAAGPIAGLCFELMDSGR